MSERCTYYLNSRNVYFYIYHPKLICYDSTGIRDKKTRQDAIYRLAEVHSISVIYITIKGRYMPLPEHLTQQISTLFSGELSPFPDIYDAVSEQVLLLIFKARHLYQHPDYGRWFVEQHQVLGELCAKSEHIGKIYKKDNFTMGHKEEPEDELLNALIFMGYLYHGFDNNNVSLKTWGEMNKQPEKWDRRFRQVIANENKFVSDDLFQTLDSVVTRF